MTDDFERSLRGTLGAAVPPSPEGTDRAAGARAYARRARRMRAAVAVGAAAVVTAAVVVVPSLLASPDGSTPTAATRSPGGPLIMPLRHPFTCTKQVSTGWTSAAAVDGVVASGAVLARICPTQERTAHWWTAPAEPLVTDVDGLVARLNALPAASPDDCTQTYEPAYSLTIQYDDGKVLAVSGQLGSCVHVGAALRRGGTDLLQTYLGMLHDQRSAYAPVQSPWPPALKCSPSDLWGGARPFGVLSLRPVVVDGRRPALTQAIVCSYRVAPHDLPRHGLLSKQQLADVSADLAAHASRQPQTTPAMRHCQQFAGPGFMQSIVGTDAWGDRIELTAQCSVFRFVDRDGAWYWTPSSTTRAMLQSVGKGPGGSLVSGTLTAVGGPAGVQPQPLAGTVTLRGPEAPGDQAYGSELTVTFDAGDDGTFSGSLAPGRYRVTGQSPSYDGGKGTCQPAHPFITVVADHAVQVDVLCQRK